jgi:cation:H+ antiporter
MTLHLIILLASGILLFVSAHWLVQGVTKISRYLQWREFVIAFFVMAIGSSLPNLFIGVSAALHGIPELSFGDIVGNSVVDLTLVAGIAVLIGSNLGAESKLVQTSTFLTISVAILPLLLVLDGVVSRGDGIVLLLIFVAYTAWLLSKRKGFTQTLDPNGHAPIKRFSTFMQGMGQIILGSVFIIASAEGVVRAASFFADTFNLPLAMIGILGLGLGSALPEIYFSIVAARKDKDLILLGQLTGSVVVLSTFVLGIVAIIQPIYIPDFSPFAIARFFLIISALFFLIFVRTGRKISTSEGAFLFVLYIAFVLAELFLRNLL